MKNTTIKIGLFVLSFVLLFSACGKTKYADIALERNDAEEQYMYAIPQSTLYRYDIANRKVTIACNDPLCKHTGDECLACNLDTDGVNLCNGCVYTVKHMSNERCAIVKYDPKSGESKIVFTDQEKKVDGFLYSAMAIAGKFLFFDTTQYFYNEDEKWVSTANLYRIDTETEEIKQVNTEPLLGEVVLRQVLDDNRLVWDFIGLEQYFTTDINFENRVDLEKEPEKAYGDYVYDSFMDKDYYSFGLTVKNIKTGEQTKICDEGILTGRLAPDGYLYMCMAEKDKRRVIGKQPNGTIEYYEYDNVIHAMNPDGGNQRILCALPDSINVDHMATNRSNDFRVGNNVGIRLADYLMTDGMITGKSTSNTLLILNIKDGSYFLLGPNT